MRYHLFLHYEWFLQNLGKDFIRINVHTTVGRLKEKNVKTESLAGRNCVICVHLREEDLQSHYK